MKKLILLATILLVGIIIRMETFNDKYFLTLADTWWFGRHTKELLENNLIPPKWDYLSHYPPGRPFTRWVLWEYILSSFYLILKNFGFNFFQALHLAPVVVITLAGLVAYIFGKYLKDWKTGLLATAFLLFSSKIISISMSGLIDTDSLVVLFSLASIFSYLLAYEKRNVKFIILAIIINLAFIWSWIGGWYPSLIFSGFIILISILNYLRGNREEIKKDLILLSLILITLNIVSQIFGLMNMVWVILERLGFFSGEMIVNISVAEMQPITKEGLKQVIFDTGLISTLSVLSFTYLLYHKHGKRELFLALWLIFGAVMLKFGIRFSLIFSIPVFIVSAYSLTYLIDSIKYEKLRGVIWVLLISMLIYQLSNSLLPSDFGAVPESWVNAFNWLEKNADKNSYVMTWWDPGHFIAWYGFKNHADGAHCPSYDCPIWDHNDRIKDMGKILSGNETEAVKIIEKYINFDKCDEEKKYFPFMPADACKKPKEVYLLLSDDLIGKFTWVSYFGGKVERINYNPYYVENEFERFLGRCHVKGDEWASCLWAIPLSDASEYGLRYNYGGMSFILVRKENLTYPFVRFGNRILLIKRLIIRNKVTDFSNIKDYEKADGLIWVHPSYKFIIYIPRELENSVFVKAFLLNQNLKHFQTVYRNNDIVLLKFLEKSEIRNK